MGSYNLGAFASTVMVGIKFVANTSSKNITDQTLAAGDVAMYNGMGVGFNSASANNGTDKRIMLRLVTPAKEPGRSFTQDFISEVLTKDDVVKTSVKLYEQPKRHAMTISLGNAVFTAGQEVILKARFLEHGNVSDANFFDMYASHKVVTGLNGSDVVTAALVADLNKTMLFKRVPTLTAYASKTGAAANLPGSVNGIGVTTGSTTITSLSGVNAINNTANLADVTVYIKGVPYVIQMGGGNTNVSTLDRPYEGVTETVPRANFTDVPASTIILIGSMQNTIDFNNHFNPIRFTASIKATAFETGIGYSDSAISGAVITLANTATTGNGYGPQVKLYEELSLAAKAGLENTDFRRMTPRVLYANVNTKYDCVTISITRGRKLAGSQVNQSIEYLIFIPSGASATATATALHTNFLANLL